ncbi:MAG: hypothetical protein H6666_11130 [Ardenticatenaceae bacterium]|nr:hypothetical protein [Anaerolineales bacterium]MCB8918468.1 hypothetical protein [Ardenticatenaceae bacterium]
MAEIYRIADGAAELRIGWIDTDGKIYARRASKHECVGWVDYDEREVRDRDDELVGWLEEEGEVVGLFEDGEAGIGYVRADGSLYFYCDPDESEEDLLVGRMTGMQDEIEGAAALLFFFEDVALAE